MTAPNLFARVSESNSRYFELTDGTAFIPIGMNICFPRFIEDEDEILSYYRSYFTQLSENGGNFVRLWLGAPFFELEPDREGEFSPIALKRIQTIVDMATELGIRIKFTLEHFRRMEPTSRDIEMFSGAASFLKSVYHRDHGGSLTDMASYFSSDAGHKIFSRKLEFLAERFRDNPTVMAWELWNEVNTVGASMEHWMSWSELMLQKLKELFPRQLSVQSLGSFGALGNHQTYDWLCSLPGNDFNQAHRYLDPGAELDVCRGPMDILCADTIRELRDRNSDSPAMLAEGGAVEWKHCLKSHLYQSDKAGMLLHDVIFAPFFAGSAGSGQCWHWQWYVNHHNLWWHFGRFAKAIEGVDPRRENYQPYFRDSQRLRIFGLRGETHDLIWCRDKANTWESELDRGVAPELLRGLELNASSVCRRSIASAEYYQPWENVSGALEVAENALRLPDFKRSIVLKINASSR